MRVVAAVLLLAASCLAAAADRSYAVISLVGDRLLIAQASMATGSRIDRNPRQFLALKSDVLDRSAVRAVDAALRAAEPAARVELLAPNDPKLYEAANGALGPEGGAALAATLAPALRGIGTTHWILVSKYRGDTRARLLEGTIGTGQLEGLGFYIDRDRNLQNVDTGEHAIGFVAPFAYLRFTLVEAASGRVLAEVVDPATKTVSSATATHPWDAFTPEEKVQALESLLRSSAAASIPRLLASPPAR